MLAPAALHNNDSPETGWILAGSKADQAQSIFSFDVESRSACLLTPPIDLTEGLPELGKTCCRRSAGVRMPATRRPAHSTPTHAQQTFFNGADKLP
jgi:hypothetical protein